MSTIRRYFDQRHAYRMSITKESDEGDLEQLVKRTTQDRDWLGTTYMYSAYRGRKCSRLACGLSSAKDRWLRLHFMLLTFSYHFS